MSLTIVRAKQWERKKRHAASTIHRMAPELNLPSSSSDIVEGEGNVETEPIPVLNDVTRMSIDEQFDQEGEWDKVDKDGEWSEIDDLDVEILNKLENKPNTNVKMENPNIYSDNVNDMLTSSIFSLISESFQKACLNKSQSPMKSNYSFPSPILNKSTLEEHSNYHNDDDGDGDGDGDNVIMRDTVMTIWNKLIRHEEQIERLTTSFSNCLEAIKQLSSTEKDCLQVE